MRRRAWSTLAPTRLSASPWRRRWRAGDPYWRGRAEVRSRSSAMRECWRLPWTRAALRPSWNACSPIPATARPSVRPRGGVPWSGIRSTGWSGVRRAAGIPGMKSKESCGRPLRIALLSSSRFWRGANDVFAALARGLADRGHTTTAVVAYEAMAGGFRERNLSVRLLPVGHTTLRGARALRGGLRELAAEIVLVDRARDIRLAAFAALRTPLAVVYCISTPRPPRDLLTRLAFRRVALTVFLTRQLAERSLAEAPFMRRAGHRVIPNGVDCDLFRPDEPAGRAFRRRHALGDGPVLLGVGALEIEKRWDLLLDGVARRARPGPPLVMCGGGALEGSRRALAGG